MNWKTVQSTVIPNEIDTTSSKIYNYIRRNVKEIEQQDIDGNKVTVYEYDELKLRKDSWEMWLELEQAKADIDFLNMLTEDL